MTNEPEANIAKAYWMKDWLARQPWKWIGGGTFMGLLAGVTLLLMGMVELQNGEKAVGIGYIVLTVVFPIGTVAAAWWMGKD